MKRALGYRHLEVFRAIMQAGSVTGAGVLLGASQPAVSRLLAQTEDLAGFPLFERVRGRLVPTAMAQTLYEEVDRIFTGLEEVAALAERLRTGAPRRVVIACLPTLTVTVLPRAVAAWRASGRQESLSVHSRAADGVMGLVSMRQADLGIGINVPAVPGVRSSLLLRSQAWCVMAPQHRLAAQPLVRAADLHGETFIALSREEGRQALVDAALRDSGARPVETVECRLAAGAVAMAAAGVGVTIADAFSVSLFLHQGLVLRRFEPAIAFDYRLIWPAGAPDTFGRAALAQHIRDAVRDLVRRVAPGP
ncbi:LysR family transcriptional regulator [Pseudoroseomonas wenyumeiae]|uniref:LysR family transcriptional regulator n=1 Tax=Teichococcus wenyumeiae TaxID=2478470 RepID=A0A3A9JBJ0_9PROT|nr:LysR substrate-binding domain-containing protein [Pseudoroseomonas wenyumeiae]RKK03852.1 LysR family transcriptional regulator [Pseudoroseomonas wenyumeiae]RMI17097.1 LysR family transcriptional regulator [Pseudoroseomonas wenyumeiae]